jgi:two-component sensor histidine kinase
MSVMLDVTERKRAEERLRASLREKEALLQEIHHRVKNNLQIVSSLLALQAARSDEPVVQEFARENQNRVRSMALIHERLYRSADLAQIDLAAHVETLCVHLFRSYGADLGRIALHMDVARTSLDLDRAIPCGLIINELVSNALKYAFPGDRAGCVAVSVSAGADRCYTLLVQDDGVGLPPGLDVRQTASLGLWLVCSLTRQLGGDLSVESGAGTTFRVRFPV